MDREANRFAVGQSAIRNQSFDSAFDALRPLKANRTGGVALGLQLATPRKTVTSRWLQITSLVL
jgi:hypothetical protein